MDSTLITATAAALGSLVGAGVSAVSNWITQRSRITHARRDEKVRDRELLYGEFITEASRLTMDALSHSLEKPDTFVKLYGILGRIRLVAHDAVLAAAEACCRQIVELYSKPNLTVEQIRTQFERDWRDPIREFSTACRLELEDIANGKR